MGPEVSCTRPTEAPMLSTRAEASLRRATGALRRGFLGDLGDAGRGGGGGCCGGRGGGRGGGASFGWGLKTYALSGCSPGIDGSSLSSDMDWNPSTSTLSPESCTTLGPLLTEAMRGTGNDTTV